VFIDFLGLPNTNWLIKRADYGKTWIADVALGADRTVATGTYGITRRGLDDVSLISKRPFQKDGSVRLKMFQQTSAQPSLRNAS
jgi:hypothetical protein